MVKAYVIYIIFMIYLFTASYGTCQNNHVYFGGFLRNREAPVGPIKGVLRNEQIQDISDSYEHTAIVTKSNKLILFGGKYHHI
jgi:hypothetical protein